MRSRFYFPLSYLERQVLREGDTVTLGHKIGERIAAGTCKRQPHSEHQFVVSGFAL